MSRRAPSPAAGLVAVLCLAASNPVGCAKGAPATSPTLDPLQQLARDITATTHLPGVQRAAWGIVVQSLERQERIYELNPRTLLVPASTAKLVSLASAVDAVGWDYRYETTVRATAPVVDGIIPGDLVIAGAGDPSIGGRGGADLSTWIDALKAQGVRRIEGRIIGDDDSVEEPRPQLAWAWDDLGYATGVMFGALNLAENRLVVSISPGSTPAAPATLSLAPPAASRPLANKTTTGPPGSPLLIWPEQRPGETSLTIAGSIPVGAPPTGLSVSAGNPTFWFASVMRHALLDSGIEVSGDAVDVDDAMPPPAHGETLLYTHRSATLAQLARPLLKDSINLYGEAVLRLNVPPGAAATNDSALAGLRGRMTSWGIPAEGWQVVDGSGLSRRNAIAAETLVAILQRMYDPSADSPWMTAFPIAGRDGTLARRMIGTSAEGNLRAKTGTMSNIRSLAGYVTTRDGETLAFAILSDNFEGSGAAATEAVDRIAVTLAAFSRTRQ